MSSTSATHSNHSTAEAAVVAANRVSWGAIFAGSVIALAFMFLITLLGIAIGAAVIDPAQDTDPAAGVPTGSAVFLIVVQLIALGVGGYVTARLAGIPRKQSSMLHGVAVWAIATFGLLYLATSTVGSVVSGATSLVTGAGKSLSSAASAIVPEDVDLSSMIPDSLPPEMKQALEKRDLTLSDLREEAMDSLRNVVSRGEQNEAEQEIDQAANQVRQSPADAPKIVRNLFDRLFSGSGAVLSEADREQAVQELSKSLGVTPEEAEQQIDEWQKAAEEAGQEARQALESARKASIEAAQKASEAVAKAAMMAFFASLLGLVAAAVGGLLGRPKELTVADR